MPIVGDIAALITNVIASSFKIGIQLSAPFLVFGLLFNLGLGVLSRLMPQMQVFFIGLPLSILLGFLSADHGDRRHDGHVHRLASEGAAQASMIKGPLTEALWQTKQTKPMTKQKTQHKRSWIDAL